MENKFTKKKSGKQNGGEEKNLSDVILTKQN